MGQHLFTVYVHPGPKYAGYPMGNLFHGREVADRVQVVPHAARLAHPYVPDPRLHSHNGHSLNCALHRHKRLWAKGQLGEKVQRGSCTPCPCAVAMCKATGSCHAASGILMGLACCRSKPDQAGTREGGGC